MARRVAVLLVLGLATTGRGAAPDHADALWAQLRAALPEALAAVADPMPPLTGPDRSDKLAWLARLALRADAASNFSERPAWRAIMGWSEPGETLFTWDKAALDTSPARYPHPAGRLDPGVDFAASVAAAQLEAKFSCDFPLRARFLARHGLIRRPLALDQGRCRRFERWAQLDRVEGIEVIFVTPTWGDPAASFGHIIFGIRHRGDHRVTGPGSETTFSYAADTRSDAEDYVLKGLTGGFDARLQIRPISQMLRRYALGEQRDLVVYDLVMDARERRDLLAQIWVQHEREMRVPYKFLTVNCARLAYDAVRAVVPDLPRHVSALMHPHEVVDALLAADRLRPRGVRYSRRGKARLAEERRAKLARGLEGVAAFGQLWEHRYDDLEGRARSLRRFGEALADAPPEPGEALLLADYLDGVIDVESFSIDRRLGRIDPAATSPALDAALDVRAQLPLAAHERLAPFPESPLKRSGSRHASLAAGVDDRGHGVSRLTVSVLDEIAGEARRAQLGRRIRMRVLVSETQLAFDGDAVRLSDKRLTILSHATLGRDLQTDVGWFMARLGFAFDLVAQSLPDSDAPIGVWARGGPALTLLETPDFAGHLVIGLQARLGGWVRADDGIRGGLGPWLEWAIPLEGSPLSRLRGAARLVAGANLAGFWVAAETDVAADLVLMSDLGLVLRPQFRWHSGGVAGKGWTATLGLGL